MNNKFIWLVSYPKSGNTWLRNILSKSLFKNGNNGIDVHAHDKDLFIERGNTVFLKSHFKWPISEAMKKRMPKKIITAQIDKINENTKGYIYIYRHPLDVLVSTLFYLANEVKMAQTKKWCPEISTHKTIDEYTKEELDKIFDIFTNSGEIPAFTDVDYGAWEENVRSWQVASKEKPVLFVKYEDLLEAPGQNIRKMAQFCGYGELDELELNKLIEEASISSMRNSAPDSYKFFYRKGVYGDFYNYFSLSQICQFYLSNKEILDELGYDHSSDCHLNQ